jgi:hypothetical protein
MKNLLLAGFSLLLAIAASESVARLFGVEPYRVETSETGWAKPDSDLGWVYNPGVHPAHEEGRAPMTILPDGRRAARANDRVGVSGKPLLFLLGCSFAAGYGIRDDETLAWRLQEAFPEFEVRNYATPGYGTHQSLLLLERLLARGERPKLVIYGFLPFHSSRNVASYDFLQALRAFGGERFAPPHVRLEDGRLDRQPPYAVPSWPLESRSASSTLLHSSYLRWRLADRETRKEPATKALLVSLDERVRQAGARLLVTVLWHDKGEAGPYLRFMRERGMDALDCTYSGPITDPARLTVGGKGHPNGMVHEDWARCAGQWVKENRGAVARGPGL